MLLTIMMLLTIKNVWCMDPENQMYTLTRNNAKFYFVELEE